MSGNLKEKDNYWSGKCLKYSVICSLLLKRIQVKLPENLFKIVDH